MRLSERNAIIERMFDLFGGPPEGWEPIPDDVLAELPCLDETDPAPAGISPAIGHPDELVWQALDRRLGVETLPLITAAPLTDLSPAALSLTLRRLDELSAHLEAAKARVTALIAGPEPVTEAARREDFSAHEISVATRTSVYAADARIRLARDLAGRLSASAAALEAGRMTYSQAVALSDATAQLSDDVTGEVEAAMLKFCHRQSLGNFKAALRGWVARKDPDFTKKARAERREAVFDHRVTGDGCGELFIRGPLEITHQIAMALTAYAANTKAEQGGTAAQRELAGLRDMVEHYLASPGAANSTAGYPS